MEPSSSLPGIWQEFLRIDANKTELFAFLVKCILKMVITKQIIATSGSGVQCVPPTLDTGNLVPCDHEEADTRMFVHVADAVSKGYHKSSYAQLTLMLLYWQLRLQLILLLKSYG